MRHHNEATRYYSIEYWKNTPFTILKSFYSIKTKVPSDSGQHNYLTVSWGFQVPVYLQHISNFSCKTINNSLVDACPIGLLDPDPYFFFKLKIQRYFRKKFNTLYYFFFFNGHKMARKDPDPAGSVINWPFWSGSKILSDQKEIFTDPQHWSRVPKKCSSWSLFHLMDSGHSA